MMMMTKTTAHIQKNMKNHHCHYHHKLRRSIYTFFFLVLVFAFQQFAMMSFPSSSTNLDTDSTTTTYQLSLPPSNTNLTATITAIKNWNYNDNVSRPFPRWGSDNNNNNNEPKEEEGISIADVVEFIKESMFHNATTFEEYPMSQRILFPEVFYVVDHDGLWTSDLLLPYSPKGRTQHLNRVGRLRKPEQIASVARNLLLRFQTKPDSFPSNIRDRYRDLLAAVSEDGGGFPYIVWSGDFKSCNYLNWKERNKSIPLFTTCASVECNHAFPMPTYKTIGDSQTSLEKWAPIMDNYKKTYPWESKIRKVVWRGSLSGKFHFENVRWRLCKLAWKNDLSNKNNNNTKNINILDIGFVKIPDRHKKATNIDLAEVGGLVPPIAPMEDFQKYLAILDVDGNSWSSRFGALLCYNSVVVKVEPKYVDYFHLKYLKPWKHYVPVKYDLSDLMEKAAFVTNPRNEVRVRAIIRAANDWCREHMVHTAIAYDVLDLWNAYVQALGQYDPMWGEKWHRMKNETLFQPEFNMTKIWTRKSLTIYS